VAWLSRIDADTTWVRGLAGRLLAKLLSQFADLGLRVAAMAAERLHEGQIALLGPATAAASPSRPSSPSCSWSLRAPWSYSSAKPPKPLQQGDAILLTTQPITGWRNPAREPARVLWLLL
jgi:hypothetical protein